jgi:hypothetical protein
MAICWQPNTLNTPNDICNSRVLRVLDKYIHHVTTAHLQKLCFYDADQRPPRASVEVLLAPLILLCQPPLHNTRISG